ncbi:hypothetical protein RvY_18448 [Ramazzottius varieornatus]|uniref:Histone-lysine N-methyltransferase n=1 Tax=Ramazzottius varieornatus TaxID=947166 RepID=A0A1D1W5S1_RAMVA|nr:hypothetical protein RvY_18448 [Ramazzottius varieornatus]
MEKNPFLEGFTEAEGIPELLAERNSYITKWLEGLRPSYIKIERNITVDFGLYGRKRWKTDDDDSICNCSPSAASPCGPNTGCLNRDMGYECPESCLTGELCQNQRLRYRQYPGLKTFYTPDRGLALFTEEDIKKGDLVIEYVGEIITNQERDQRLHIMSICGDEDYYFLDLTEGRVIDAGPAGNLARFANHSCDENCSSEKWKVDGETRIALIAIKDIQAGEEITFDYRWQYQPGVPSRKCFCGTEKCRGEIGGKSRLQAERQTKKKHEPLHKEPARNGRLAQMSSS